ncbi:MAG: hypothetical protein IJL12_04375 [Selenomonadaceae bacterium]|nr:hypothetical protein [Selenomonadaceae bacterium]MBQ6131557.1 hypothetical protein [Selenomonadaceae bacterium]
MKLYPDSKVYIFCPAQVQTGGPESLHQLASKLISLGVETYITYSEPLNNEPDPVHAAYKKYHVPYTYLMTDDAKNVIIAAETITANLYGAKKIRRVLWWMSVDNYLGNVISIMEHHQKNPLAKPLPKYFTFDKADKDIEHWGQSEYVRQFLRLNGISKVASVETHMSQTFLSRAEHVDLAEKENFVAYNPKKGFEITKQLIDIAPEIDWQPIENMTPAQVQEFLARAKVYIDFGEFPGRERLPREAILSGCVVIVGKRGAAANDFDINIPAEFKFGLEDSTPRQVIEKIRAVFENFPEACAKQKAFRDKEGNAQKNFETQIINVFGIKKLPPPSVAFVQGVSEGSFLLAQELFKSKDFRANFIVDDVFAAAEISNELILREQNRNYLRVGKNLIEIITQDDAKFLYLEGRIKKFALFEPTDTEIDALKNFYTPAAEDVLIFSR